MNIQIRILNASGNLTPYKNLIRRTIRAAINKVRSKISINNIDIVIKETENPELLKDLNGIGAYCPSGHFVQLNIDIRHASFGKSLEKLIEKSLIHELHHAARRQAGIKIDKSSFLECLFSEGLADYFVYEITGGLPKWIKMAIKDKKRIITIAKQKINKKLTMQDYEDWFITGSKKHKIPRWTGYAFGYKIVKNFLEKNPKHSVESLTTVLVSKIITNQNKEQYIR